MQCSPPRTRMKLSRWPVPADRHGCSAGDARFDACATPIGHEVRALMARATPPDLRRAQCRSAGWSLWKADCSLDEFRRAALRLTGNWRSDRHMVRAMHVRRHRPSIGRRAHHSVDLFGRPGEGPTIAAELFQQTATAIRVME